MAENTFESSDSVRSARALRHVQSVTFGEPLLLELGGSLPSVTVAFETYGKLNAARDNAVLVCHAISGDSHVARHDAGDDAGWWDVLVGPGKPVDTDRLFVSARIYWAGAAEPPGRAAPTPRRASRTGAIFRPSRSAI